MPNIGPVELVIILVIALLVIGPGKLPDVGSALGKSIREFRKAATDVQESVKLDAPIAPVAPAPARCSCAGTGGPRRRGRRAPRRRHRTGGGACREHAGRPGDAERAERTGRARSRRGGRRRADRGEGLATVERGFA